MDAANAALQQLVGLDVRQLVILILQGVETAQRNKHECRELGDRVRRLAGVLHLRPAASPDAMRRAEVRDAMAALEDTLRQAHALVQSCQPRRCRRGGAAAAAVRQLVTAWGDARRLRDVRERLDFYLALYPVVAHVDVADGVRRLRREVAGGVVVCLLSLLLGAFCLWYAMGTSKLTASLGLFRHRLVNFGRAVKSIL
ncbi:hypothetical protein ACP4OV_002277 [Aristida adscensionis]